MDEAFEMTFAARPGETIREFIPRIQARLAYLKNVEGMTIPERVELGIKVAPDGSPVLMRVTEKPEH